jgi:hypothetical protein
MTLSLRNSARFASAHLAAMRFRSHCMPQSIHGAGGREMANHEGNIRSAVLERRSRSLLVAHSIGGPRKQSPQEKKFCWSTPMCDNTFFCQTHPVGSFG